MIAAELAARAQTEPRSTSAITADFAAAAEHLAAIAGDWKHGQFRTADLADADAALTGLRSLLIELRARGGGDANL